MSDTPDEHDGDAGMWNEISCPLCGGTGMEEAIAGPVMCSRCLGTGLIEQKVTSEQQKRAAETAREVASHLHLGHRLFKTASDLVVRELSKKGAPPLEYALIQNDLAQTHALLAIAELLKGA